MSHELRLSHQGLRILRVFLNAFSEDAHAELAGIDLMKTASVSSGTLYPILVRLEKAGVLSSRWETARPERLGRPRRRYYRITSSGVQLARKALDELSAPFARLTPKEA
ncbi:MAG TPA: PadR family transcriptional regulator [Vicinamibacterales bacterium]|nr:PadR family transcriptional regulator [Vicinamibacterales bacterium]